MIERLGPAEWLDPRPGQRTEVIAKTGGSLGDQRRYFYVSEIASNTVALTDPLDRMFVDVVDGLAGAFGYPMGKAEGECMAFAVSDPGEQPDDWEEVAGGAHNGATLEEIIEEIEEDDTL